jgi:endoglucanase
MASKQRKTPADRVDAAASRAYLDLLRSLSEAVAVSGEEGPVRALVAAAVRDHVDELSVDALGSVYAVKRRAGGGRGQRVLISVHMDEIGFMISGVDGDGSLRFETVGGVDDRQWVGKPVWVGADKLPGLIAAAPVHLLSQDRRSQVIRASGLRIDIGADNDKSARALAGPGTRGTFASTFTVVGSGDTASLRGKALDNRLGVVTAIELLRRGPYPCELHVAFTVQEEIGLRGAKVAAYRVDPVAAFALDSTPAYDLPPSQDGRENVQYNTRLGLGPALYRSDHYTIGDARLISHLEAVARAAGLRYQFRQPGGGGTDAGAIHKSRAGIPSLSVSVPGRYAHTAHTLVRLADWRGLVALMNAALSHWSGRVLR